jgi:hypothetical protein
MRALLLEAYEVAMLSKAERFARVLDASERARERSDDISQAVR